MLTINNTLDGYLKDVEIKGNTIQSASNLADIRSVGDKVEGQELYEIPVLSRGKNLCPYNSVNFGSMSYNDRLKKYPFILPKGTYKLSFKQGDTGGAIFDNNGVKLNDSSTMIFTIDNTQIVYFYGNQNINYVDIQIEEGTVATPYEPYVEDKLTILSPVQLEKVGDVADRIICKDGVWGVEKNIENKNFDGSENWREFNVNIDSVNKVTLEINDNVNNTNVVMCDKFKYLPSNEDEEHIRLANAKEHIRVFFNKDKASSLTEWKSWLNINPIHVKYATNSPQFIPLPHDQQVKLRTFANKTNISFGCEIEGTIKAQVPKSIGATVNTHTEQINNLNKELDRVKKLEESTVSIVTTESDFTTVEQTSNGYFEDVKLEGKTLVNLVNYTSGLFNFLNANKDENNVFTLKWGSNENSSNIRPRKGTHNYKPNTTYTVVVNIIENTANARLGMSEVNGCIKSFPLGYVFDTLIGTSVLLLETDDMSTTDYRNDLHFCSWDRGGDLTKHIKFTYMILEGDHTQNPPSYFEGLKSVGQSASKDATDEIVVSSVSENLFDTEGLTYLKSSNVSVGVHYNEMFTKTEQPQQRLIGKPILLPKNNTLKTYFECEGYQLARIFFDKKLRFVRDVSWQSNNTTISPRDNEAYVASYIRRNDGAIMSQSDIEFVKQNAIVTESVDFESITYTPHQSDKKRLLYYNNETQAWEKPILRQWDSIEKHADGKYYYHKRSGEVVLNGSENWSINSQIVKDGFLAYYFKPTDGITCSYFAPMISDKFYTLVYNGSNGMSDWVEGCMYHGWSFGINIVINTSKLQTADIAGFKKWLQANNVTVVYQLAEEKIYECTNIDLITYNGETNFIVESGVLSPKTTLKVHNNISNVVSLLQKKVSLLESDITSYMITQNRLQLSSTYSADSVTFKVDYSVCSENRSQENYDTDLYNLILNNILVGKDNYDYDHMFNIIMDYASWSQISWDQFDILVGIMDLQHNPPIEPPIEEVPCETPEE